MTKKSTKFLSAILVLVMLVTLTVPAFAADRPQRTSYSYTTVNVGAYQIQVSDFWIQDSSVDFYRAYAETGGKVAMLTAEPILEGLDSDSLWLLDNAEPGSEMFQELFGTIFDSIIDGIESNSSQSIYTIDNGWTETSNGRCVYRKISYALSGIPTNISLLLYTETGSYKWLLITCGCSSNTDYQYEDDLFGTISRIKTRPAPGQVVGQVLATDIKAYINGAEIPAYNIDGKLAVLVSDLNNYGFTTEYNDRLRKTTVKRNPYSDAAGFVSVPSKSSGLPVGTPVMSVFSTDIVVELEGIQIPAFNVDNRMAIYFTELQRFGAYGYDNYTRASYLNLSGVDTAYIAPQPEPPMTVIPLVPEEPAEQAYISDGDTGSDTVSSGTITRGGSVDYDNSGDYSGSGGSGGSSGSGGYGSDSRYDNPYLSSSSSGMTHVVNMETGKTHNWRCRYVKGNYNYPRMYTDDPYRLIASDSFFSFCGVCD